MRRGLGARRALAVFIGTALAFTPFHESNTQRCESRTKALKSLAPGECTERFQRLSVGTETEQEEFVWLVPVGDLNDARKSECPLG